MANQNKLRYPIPFCIFSSFPSLSFLYPPSLLRHLPPPGPHTGALSLTDLSTVEIGQLLTEILLINACLVLAHAAGHVQLDQHGKGEGF